MQIQFLYPIALMDEELKLTDVKVEPGEILDISNNIRFSKNGDYIFQLAKKKRGRFNYAIAMHDAKLIHDDFGRLDDNRIINLAKMYDVSPHAVLAVAFTQGDATSYNANSSIGYLPDGRPLIEFHRDIFHELTGGQFSDSLHMHFSSQHLGGYRSRLQEWDRFLDAFRRSSFSAVQAASWGQYKLMGYLYELTSLETPEQMAYEMFKNDLSQLKVLIEVLVADGLLGLIEQSEYLLFARTILGPGYTRNRIITVEEYATQLETQYKNAKVQYPNA